jgi:hypothetical protein
MADVVHELLVGVAALDKLGARGIHSDEVAQVTSNDHVVLPNAKAGGADPGTRRLLIGDTDGGRVITFVIEQTVEPTTWMVVTGWNSTPRERTLLKGA